MFIEGQKVICINDDFSLVIKKLYKELPVKDEIYTVRAVFPAREKLAVIRHGKIVPNGGSEAAPGIGILLKELTNPPDPFCSERELGFTAERFAPLETIETEEEESIETWGEVEMPMPA